VNPLRPYYIPPSIGEPIEPTSIPGPKPFSHGNSTGQYASRARDIFSDLDYKDYISEPSPSAVRSFKELVDELLWKYTSVLMAQPFEVAKTILQVRTQDDLGGVTGLVSPAERPRQPNSYKGSSYGDVSLSPLTKWKFCMLMARDTAPRLRLGIRPGRAGLFHIHCPRNADPVVSSIAET